MSFCSSGCSRQTNAITQYPLNTMLRAMPFLAETDKLISLNSTHQALSAAVQRSHGTAVALRRPPESEKTIARNMHFSGKSQKQPLTSGTMRKHLVKFHDIRNNRNSSRLNSILHGTSRFQAEQNDRQRAGLQPAISTHLPLPAWHELFSTRKNPFTTNGERKKKR